jgi:hypothetical protein
VSSFFFAYVVCSRDTIHKQAINLPVAVIANSTQQSLRGITVVGTIFAAVSDMRETLLRIVLI